MLVGYMRVSKMALRSWPSATAQEHAVLRKRGSDQSAGIAPLSSSSFVSGSWEMTEFLHADEPADEARAAPSVAPWADSNVVAGLTGEFAASQTFAVIPDVASDRYVVQDASLRRVALLPREVGRGEEVLTRAGRWRIAPERTRFGWAVIARTVPDGSVVARASPRSWLNTAYKLSLAPDVRCQLTRRPLASVWTLRIAQRRIASVRFDPSWLIERPSSVPAGSISIYASAIGDPPLALLLALALETIRADRAIVVPRWAG